MCSDNNLFARIKLIFISGKSVNIMNLLDFSKNIFAISHHQSLAIHSSRYFHPPVYSINALYSPYSPIQMLMTSKIDSPQFSHTPMKHSQSCYMTPKPSHKTEESPSHDTTSTATRYRVLKRSRDDSGSNSKQRRFKKESNGMQFMSMKKLEEIIKTVAEKNRADEESKAQDSKDELTAPNKQRLNQTATSTNSQGYRSLRNHTITTTKPEPLPTSKVIDPRAIPPTPKKNQSQQATSELQRQKQLQNTIKDLEKRLEEKVTLQNQFSDLMKKFKAEQERNTKLLDRINLISKDKEVAIEELQKMQKKVGVRGEAEGRRLQEENSRLRQENSRLRQQIGNYRLQINRLIKLSKSYQDRLTQTQRTRSTHQLQLRAFTQKQKSLQSLIQTLKRQLEPLNDLRQQLHKTTTDLNYYKVNAHCLKRQLEEGKVEISRMVTQKVYGELKAEYTRLQGQLREVIKGMPVQQQQRGRCISANTVGRGGRGDEIFQLTPEK